ncbi:TetR family transcriptional regulator [Xanthomonas sp. Kuri4-2]
MSTVKKAQQGERRADALSKERIVAAAIEMLDEGGEAALTFRALAVRLATGAGALYWHVADKGELLATAADDVLRHALVLPGPDAGTSPEDSIRTTALNVFDAVDAHPWAGALLTREPWRPGALALFESLGGALLALGVPAHARFGVWSALVNYIVGAAGQNAANAASARLRPDGSDRNAFLQVVATRWEQLDPKRYPFVRELAQRMPGHDDREQFVAGIDLILDGIAASCATRPSPVAAGRRRTP